MASRVEHGRQTAHDRTRRAAGITPTVGDTRDPAAVTVVVDRRGRDRLTPQTLTRPTAPTSRVIRTVAAAGGAEPEQRGRGRSPAPAPGPPPAGGRPTGRHCRRPQGRSTGPLRGQCTGRLSSTTKPMWGSLSVRSDATIWAMVVWEIPVDVAIQRPVQPK